MKKWMKRLISVTLIAVMTLGLSSVALAADETPHFTFTNKTDSFSETGDLYVSKTVSSVLEGYTVPDTTFTFTLTWDSDGDGVLTAAGNVSYELFNADGTQVSGTYTTSATGTFTLESGQYVRFTGTGEVAYEVTETPVDNFLQTSPAGGQAAAGTISADGTVAAFQNLYIPSGSGTGGGGGGEGDTTLLAVRKDIYLADGMSIPDSMQDAEFAFQITLNGSAYANKTYTIYDAAMTLKQGTGTTDGDGKFTLSGGQLAIFDNIDIGVDYEVTELTSADGWQVVGDDTYTGTTADPIVYAYFTNTVGTGGFTVTKTRADGVTGTDGGTFTFTLTGADNAPLSGITYYLYDASGNLVTTAGNDTGVYTTALDGTFTLEAGQKAEFFDMVAGTEYKIVETDLTDGYTVDPAAGYSGTVTASEDPTYTFTNTQLTNITVVKTDGASVERRLAGAEFTIYRLKDGGSENNDEDWEAYPNAESATKTTSSDLGRVGELEFTDLPAGTYKIVETKTPAGYIAAGEPIVVTLPYTTTESGVNGAIYSGRDEVYYLYSLTYTVSNTATLVMPNTGGSAWIIILFAALGGSVALVSVCVFRGRSGRKAKVREHE